MLLVPHPTSHWTGHQWLYSLQRAHPWLFCKVARCMQTGLPVIKLFLTIELTKTIDFKSKFYCPWSHYLMLGLGGGCGSRWGWTLAEVAVSHRVPWLILAFKCHHHTSVALKRCLWIDSIARTVRFKDNPDGAPVFAPADIILLNDGGRGGALTVTFVK